MINKQHTNPVIKWEEITLAACALISMMLIIGAASGDLWLDEIWSLNFTKNINSALDIL